MAYLRFPGSLVEPPADDGCLPHQRGVAEAQPELRLSLVQDSGCAHHPLPYPLPKHQLYARHTSRHEHAFT